MGRTRPGQQRPQPNTGCGLFLNCAPTPHSPHSGQVWDPGIKTAPQRVNHRRRTRLMMVLPTMSDSPPAHRLGRVCCAEGPGACVFSAPDRRRSGGAPCHRFRQGGAVWGFVGAAPIPVGKSRELRGLRAKKESGPSALSRKSPQCFPWEGRRPAGGGPGFHPAHLPIIELSLAFTPRRWTCGGG